MGDGQSSSVPARRPRIGRHRCVCPMSRTVRRASGLLLGMAHRSLSNGDQQPRDKQRSTGLAHGSSVLAYLSRAMASSVSW